jgi:hypothetical protein
MDDYKKWEDDCEKIRKNNKKLINIFSRWLADNGLKQKTINVHTNNVDFYINEFLLYEDAIEPQNGMFSISMYLGYWFIKKAGWSSVSAIKSNAGSLKKFYAFLVEQQMIEPDDYSEFLAIIKEEMPEWTATMQRYDDPDIEDMEEVWG